MKFFRYEGRLSEGMKSGGGPENGWVWENNRDVARYTSDFNERFNGDCYYFVSMITKNYATFGIICREKADTEKQMSEFLKKIEMEYLENRRCEEITYKNLSGLLQRAWRGNYIEDIDGITEEFELEPLSGRWLRAADYGEGIIAERTKKEILKTASDNLFSDCFGIEIERIYSGGKKSFSGHPVHYMIETDDGEICKGIYTGLTEALYANGRVENKRFFYIEAAYNSGIGKNALDSIYKGNTGGTVIIKYKGEEESEDDRASCSRETVRIICDIMKKYSNRVLTVFCFPGECTKTKSTFFEYSGDNCFVEIREDLACAGAARKFLKNLASGDGIKGDRRLYSAIAEDKTYKVSELRLIYNEWYGKKLRNSLYPQYRNIVSVKYEIADEKPRGTAVEELNEMTGLKEAKKVIMMALDYYKAQKLFRDRGMTAEKPSMHMVFTGNPGTAKTTVARLFGQILRENGILSGGQFVEAGRGDLVGKYVGWTAPTIQNKFREAKGGVLFIDEAYSLVDDRDGSYGDEAINTIVQEMENHRDDVVVIFAGYPDKMEGFLNKNPGLRSRIAFQVPFEDYTVDELCEIAKLIARKKGLVLDGGACDRLADIFETARLEEGFGNGRFVRNILEKAKMSQASRLVSMDYEKVSDSDIVTVVAEDIEAPEKKGKTIKTVIGF